ncbi:DUF1254 domain-containing protein [Vibrio comitans]|uniref:DUF1254 domain-containing protein n=1 Tax=Vibrio comitans NBRC 102076 TaxID=1219078 RepID=A0A4Y3IT72_9VIBR|nr:DUF1254 domain-containing protein [Vibrio comitans]GEA61930.1 hypothetical protein VCO01S_31230 [Vibrio comitans NBRC 102076]
MKRTFIAVALTSALFATPLVASAEDTIRFTQASEAVQAQDQQKIAQLAYEYAYSIDEAYKYFYHTAIEADYPLNRFENIRILADHTYTAHPTINNDTLHVMGWMDLAAEPVIITIPKQDEGRYWLLHTMDMGHYTDSTIGSVAYGAEGGMFMYALEGWEGEVPESVTEVIYVEHPISKLMGRIMDTGGEDSVKARRNMDGWNLRTLSEFLGEKGPDPVVRDYPNPADTNWIERVNFVLSEGTMRDHDADLLEQFSLLKLGEPVGTKFTTAELKLIEQGEKDGFEHISNAGFDDSRLILGTREEMSIVPSFQHAFGTYLGQWGLPAEHTLYQGVYVDSEGQQLDGSKYDYTVTFTAPPIEDGGFWSYTNYGGESLIMEYNELNRHSRGDRTMVPNEDGTYTLTMSAKTEDKADDPNFLPIPNGTWYSVLRIYTPGEDAREDVWQSAPFIRVEK